MALPPNATDVSVNVALIGRIVCGKEDSGNWYNVGRYTSGTLLQPLRESGAQQPMGDWWATPAAHGALAALDAACGASGVPAPF